MGSRRAGRGFKRSLEAVGFNLAEFELKRTHGDPIRDHFMDFGHASWRSCLRERYLCLRETYFCLRESERERETYICLRFFKNKNMEYIYICVE